MPLGHNAASDSLSVCAVGCAHDTASVVDTFPWGFVMPAVCGFDCIQAEMPEKVDMKKTFGACSKSLPFLLAEMFASHACRRLRRATHGGQEAPESAEIFKTNRATILDCAGSHAAAQSMPTARPAILRITLKRRPPCRSSEKHLPRKVCDASQAMVSNSVVREGSKQLQPEREVNENVQLSESEAQRLKECLEAGLNVPSTLDVLASLHVRSLCNDDIFSCCE